jgi:hypothetical protein
MTDKATSPLDGDLGRAVVRLKTLTDRACGFLDATTLNVLSFHLAVYLDHDADSRAETDRLTGELRTEQEAMRRQWRNLGDEIALD